MVKTLLLVFFFIKIPTFGQQFLLKGFANQQGPLTYELTKDSNGISGMITNHYPLDLTKNFNVTFDINLGTDDNGADGIAFLMTRSCNPTLMPGSGLGVSGTSNSMIVEFDTYDNGFFPPDNDIPDDHTAIYADGDLSSNNNITDGTTIPVCMMANCQNVEDGNWYTVNIQWTYISATVQKIEVYVNGSLRVTSTGNHIADRFLNQNYVFYSIAASTGGCSNQHQVRFPTNNNPSYCGGQSLILHAPSQGSNYVWSNGNTSSLDSATYTNLTGNQTITCTYIDYCGQSRTVSFAINVTAGIFNASPSQKICLHSIPNSISVNSVNTGTSDSLKFVYFNSKQSNPNMYTGGKTLANIFPISNTSSYTFPSLGNNGSLPDSVGTYYVYAIIDPAPGNSICKPSQEIIISIDSPKSKTIVQSICLGDSVGNHKSNGTYIDTLKSIAGCDSIRTLVLTVNPKSFDTVVKSICQGDSFLGRKNNGIYTDTLRGANKYYCDSIRTLQLTVSPKSNSFFTKTICAGDSFLSFKKTGIYYDTFFYSNLNHCDSIRKVDLTVISPKYSHSVKANECESYNYKGKVYTSSVQFVDTLKSTFGCDSIIDTIGINIIRPRQNSENKIIGCDTVIYNSQTYTSSAYFNEITKSKLNASCDSIITPIKIEVRPKPSVSIMTTPQPPFAKNDKITLTVLGRGQILWNTGDTTKNIYIVLSTNTSYSVVITDSNQCSKQEIIDLKVEQNEVFVPNAFSPNGDQINDAFYPIFDSYVEILSMSIFNRWGEKLYDGKGNSVSWDGKYKNESQPNGVYVYFIEYKNGAVVKSLKGTLSLIK